MSPKPLIVKPGAERRGFVPDRIVSFPVKESCGTILEYLMMVLSDAKRTSVKELLKHNRVMVNGHIVRKADMPLEAGDDVQVNFTREFQIFSHPRLKIEYEDDDIIVVYKGYGLLSVATDNNKSKETAYSILRDYLKRKDPRNKLFVVHRLDQQTSGLMMFAKNQHAKDTMQHNWNNMVISRTYVAVVEGRLDQQEGVVQSYLAENSAHEVYSTKRPEDGKLAVTRYKVLDERPAFSLVELSLDTGRKNQIRVHMKDLGHPISGDKRYGARTSPIHRMALHARTLRFVHPVTRKDMNFTSSIPASFYKLR